MPKVLTQTQIDQFHEQGFVSPIRVMSDAEALGYRSRLERFERETGGSLSGHLRHKTHLLFTWLADLVRHPRILDAVEDLYGPDLLCWTTNFFIKEKANPAFVSWHQDSTYWGLSQPDVVTAWVAFTLANAGNGAMEVIPGSHKLDQIPHRDTFAKHNLLTRGQEIAVEVDQSKAVRLDLEPGEISLHHVRLVHGSPANTSDDRRIGFAIRYIPTHLRQLFGDDSASLVRGEDRYGNFELEPDRSETWIQPCWRCIRQSPNAMPRSCIGGPTSRATMTRARWAYDEGLRRRARPRRRNRHCRRQAAAAAP